MSLIITFMFEPAKLQMNWARASGARNARHEREAPADSELAPTEPVPVRLGCRDRACGEDQREVAERLWEVADLPPAAHVVLLGEQAEVVGQREEPLEQAARVVDAAVHREGADQPERAGQELALVTRQAVVGLGGRVARHEAVPAELARDR